MPSLILLLAPLRHLYQAGLSHIRPQCKDYPP